MIHAYAHGSVRRMQACVYIVCRRDAQVHDADIRASVSWSRDRYVDILVSVSVERYRYVG